MTCAGHQFGHNFIIRTAFGYVCSQCNINQNDLRKEKKVEKTEVKPSKISNERQLVLKDFLDRLNPPRIKAGYKPYKPAYMGMKLSHLNTQDLYFFLSECKHANNFSKYFHWALRVK